jgi:hypothetical protein
MALLMAVGLSIRPSWQSGDPPRIRFALGLSMGLVAFVLTWLTGHPLLNLSNQLWLAGVLAVGLAALPFIASGHEDDVVAPSASASPSWFLHGSCVGAMAVVTLVALSARAVAVTREADPVASRSAGVYGWELAPTRAGAVPEVPFRWTRARAAIREPIRGRQLTVPLYLARPDIPAESVTLELKIDGVRVDPVQLTTNGWLPLTYDLAQVIGEARLKSQPTVMVELNARPPVVPARVSASDDTRELGVGLGAVRWESPPDASEGRP